MTQADEIKCIYFVRDFALFDPMSASKICQFLIKYYLCLITANPKNHRLSVQIKKTQVKKWNRIKDLYIFLWS